MNKIAMFLLIFFFNLSCVNMTNQDIIIGDELVKGANIFVKDTFYNGNIKFYNLKTGKLTHIDHVVKNVSNGLSKWFYPNGKLSIVYNYVNGKIEGLSKSYDSIGKLTNISNYVNGIQNGLCKSFYSNGKPFTISKFENGKKNGYITMFDSLGNIYEKYFCFYGEVLGPMTTYSENNPIEYKFYTFDGYKLLEIKYDKLDENNFKGENESLIFCNHSYVTQNVITGELKNEYFIYLPSPDNYNFSYTLNKMDTLNKKVDYIKTFPKNKLWEKFDLICNGNKLPYYYFIKLEVYNKKNNIIYKEEQKLW